jgi:hypothetical protein
MAKFQTLEAAINAAAPACKPMRWQADKGMSRTNNQQRLPKIRGEDQPASRIQQRCNQDKAVSQTELTAIKILTRQKPKSNSLTCTKAASKDNDSPSKRNA